LGWRIRFCTTGRDEGVSDVLKNDEFWQWNLKVSFMLPESLLRDIVPVIDEDGFVTNDIEQGEKFEVPCRAQQNV
jgi:hypothetical protein